MKHLIGLIIFTTFMVAGLKSQTTHTININGFSFSPGDLTIQVSDTVFFNGSDMHPVLEVSESTWNANGNTALSGGFAFPSGSGKISFDEEGIHFYICENHVSSGMKGKINVTATSTNINHIGYNKIRIYPNPLTINYLTIEIPDNSSEIKLSIYDLTGRVKIREFFKPSDNQIKINGSNLISGAYIIQLDSKEFTYTSKFIKH